MERENERTRTVSVGVPDGKYSLIPAAALCAAWQAYRVGRIRFIDVRVWFAAHEMVERRCMLAENRLPSYTPEELAVLVGGSAGEHLRSSVRRLTAVGLLEWTGTRIGFPPCKAEAGLTRMLGLVANHRRQVPIPRRILRYMATARQPAVVATILGLCLRGLYHRAGACHAGGTCKASWVAGTFGVCIRSVRRARQHLEGIGWVSPLSMPHWHQQRYGESFIVNLSWLARARPRSSLSPRQPVSTTELSPPGADKDLPAEVQNTEPAAVGPTGDLGRNQARPTPRLNAITDIDLANASRIEALWRQAVERRLVRASAAERLNFFAAAFHARRVGRRNPSGLFATLVRRRLWATISMADEDESREALRRLGPVVWNPAATSSAAAHPLGDRSTANTDAVAAASVRALIQRSLSSVGALW